MLLVYVLSAYDSLSHFNIFSSILLGDYSIAICENHSKDCVCVMRADEPS